MEETIKRIDGLAANLIEMNQGDLGETFGVFVEDNAELIEQAQDYLTTSEAQDAMQGVYIDKEIMDNLDACPAIKAALTSILSDAIGTLGLFFEGTEDEDWEEDETDNMVYDETDDELFTE